MGPGKPLDEIAQMGSRQGVGHLVVLGRGPDPVPVPRCHDLRELIEMGGDDALRA